MFTLYLKPFHYRDDPRDNPLYRSISFIVTNDCTVATTAKLYQALLLCANYQIKHRRGTPIMKLYRLSVTLRVLMVVCSALFGWAYTLPFTLPTEIVTPALHLTLMGFLLTLVTHRVVVAHPEVAYQRTRYRLFRRLGEDYSLSVTGKRGAFLLSITDIAGRPIAVVEDKADNQRGYLSHRVMPYTWSPKQVQALFAAEILKDVPESGDE